MNAMASLWAFTKLLKSTKDLLINPSQRIKPCSWPGRICLISLPQLSSPSRKCKLQLINLWIKHYSNCSESFMTSCQASWLVARLRREGSRLLIFRFWLHNTAMLLICLIWRLSEISTSIRSLKGSCSWIRKRCFAISWLINQRNFGCLFNQVDIDWLIIQLFRNLLTNQ